MLPLLMLLACPTPTAPDSGGPTDSDPPTAWAPLSWSDCQPLLDVGNLAGRDDRMLGRPAVLGDRAWFTMLGHEGLQSIGTATLVDPTTLEDVALFLDGPALGVLDASSPAPVVAPDGTVALFFDAWEVELGLGLWRCDLDAVGRPGTCEGVLPMGTHGSLDLTSAHIPFVHVDDQGLWRLWYTGMDAAGIRHILASTSDDGWTWAPPVLAIDVGDAGAWDASSAYSPFVWQDETGWRMLYAGRAEHEGYLVKRVIEARSDDAVTWSDHTMTLDLGCAGAWDAWRVDSPWVVSEGSGHRLYYDGFDDPLTDVGVRRLLTATD